MKLIIGLGNPGKEYEKSRHNVGWMVIDELIKKLELEKPHEDKKMKAFITMSQIGPEKIILAKPTTFMNLSGESVAAISNFYKIPPENVWVVFDELDLPLGQLRIRKEGGPGTHNGMKSVVETIGKNFPRFRIGIESRGVTSPEKQDTSSFVLAPFIPDETATSGEILKKTVDALIIGLKDGLDAAMNASNNS